MESLRLLLYKIRTRPFYIMVSCVRRAKKLKFQRRLLSLYGMAFHVPVIILIRKWPMFMECSTRFGFILSGSLATDSKVLCADKSAILTFYVNLRPLPGPLLDLSIT